MSATYSWRPVTPPPPPSGDIDIALAQWIAERIGTDRGQLTGYVLTSTMWIHWLEAIAMTHPDSEHSPTATDARALIAALHLHGEIEIVVER